MAEFTGKCLCGQVSYKSHVKPTLILNCHCEDCRRSTGAVYSTNVFVEDDKVEIIGKTSEYSHIAKSGNTMTKHFCENCGSLMFGYSSGRNNIVSIRAGTIDQIDVIEPTMNVFVDSKVISTPIDSNLAKAGGMPIGTPWKND